VVFRIAVRIFSNSSQSFSRDCESLSSIKETSRNSFSQYLVSLASLWAIFIFEIKSFLEDAAMASSIFAPIEVPDLTICRESSVDFLSFCKKTYSLTIRKENW